MTTSFAYSIRVVSFNSAFLASIRPRTQLSRAYSVTHAPSKHRKSKLQGPKHAPFSGSETLKTKNPSRTASDDDTPILVLNSSKSGVVNHSPKLGSGGPSISFDQNLPYPNNDLSSTRPAPLDSPEAPNPDEHDGAVPFNVRAKYYYRLGRSYLSFYKTGIKNVRANYNEYRQIKARLGHFAINDIVKYGGQDGRPNITRREYQLYLRTRHDLKTLIPFGIILAIFGEWTPLVILAMGSAVVPFTCRIPRQVNRDRQKLVKRWTDLYLPDPEANSGELAPTDQRPKDEKRQLERLNHDMRIIGLAKVDLERSIKTAIDLCLSNKKREGEHKSRIEVITPETRLAYLWGIYPTPTPLKRLNASFYLPLFRLWVHPRVRRRAEEVLFDWILIQREGGVSRLESAEIVELGQKTGSAHFAYYLTRQLARGENAGVGVLDLEDAREHLSKPLEQDMEAGLKALEKVQQYPDLHYLAGLGCVE